ncbi:MAG: hypothetical protein K2O73_05755, partial [Lachnospiraceae bacterium]|nr:hypothetical protein [Lachnospiraceae bacterium]
MFHREIIINYGELDTAKEALAYYVQALTGLQEGIREVWTALENGEGEAHDALMTSKELLSERISLELEAAEDTRSVLESYIADMTAIITPDIRGQRMLVDRNDIWGNMVTMEAQIAHLGGIDHFVRVWAWETCTLHPDDKTRRKEEGYYKRVQAVKNDIILPYAGRIASIFEEMWSIYDNQVKAYENMDDEYESITKANYWKHTDYWDRASDDLERLCIGVKDFVVGFVQGAVDVVVGLMDVVIGLVCLLTAGITWGVYKQYDLDPPDWASDRLEGAGNTATALLEDPLLIVEGISQGATDAVEQKGICYCAGYLTGSIIADKGLSEEFIALRSQSAVSRTGMISTTGKFSAEGMSHVDDVTRAGVRS